MRQVASQIWEAIGGDGLLILIAWTAAVLAASVLPAAEPYTVDGVRFIDGDTIHVDVLHLGFGVALTDVTVRAANFDAWEASKRRQSVKVTDAEVAKGQAALKALARKFESGVVTLKPVKQPYDRYGRLLAEWYVDGESVADWMKANGHVRGN